jgi:hypothetical protein
VVYKTADGLRICRTMTTERRMLPIETVTTCALLEADDAGTRATTRSVTWDCGGRVPRAEVQSQIPHDLSVAVEYVHANDYLNADTVTEQRAQRETAARHLRLARFDDVGNQPVRCPANRLPPSYDVV